MVYNNKITIFINSLGGGGAEKISIIIANGLYNKGFNIEFVVLNLNNKRNKKYMNNNIPFINLNKNHARTSFAAVYNYLKQYKPDKILVFNHELAVVIQLIKSISGVKFEIIARNISNLTQKKKNEKSFWHRFIKDKIIKIFYKKIDKIIAQTELMKRDLIDNYKVDKNKIVVINNPIGEVFEKIALTKNEKYFKEDEILFVGRLESVKGLYYLLNAFKIVFSKNNMAVLRLVGEGTTKKKLIEYAEKLQVADNVFFENYQTDLIPFYKNAKVTALSSLYEGFPNVLIESISCGTPVVAFDCNSGPSEIIIDGVNGFLARYKDVPHLAELLLKTLDYPWDIEKIKKTADKFYTDKIVDKYIQLLQEQR
jgi:glycosyltransferase involved in cell wall biosynthesis